MVYIQNIGRTIISVKKLYHDNVDIRQSKRWLLSLSETKACTLPIMEDALLEPPYLEKHWKRIWYLPKLTGETLDKCPRRVFVDMGSPGRFGAERWIKKRYPRRNKEFEIVNVVLVHVSAINVGRRGDVAEWLRLTVHCEI
ncbi:hypothetical protein KSP40_PGU009337 [Platanthera guangdongensis]|uniref:DUF7870 domain-containing protein n=1 Tax=Platanthera guangdongensis TaxID=2320717 RepID=A0ABR2LQH1_9ASPA